MDVNNPSANYVIMETVRILTGHLSRMQGRARSRMLDLTWQTPNHGREIFERLRAAGTPPSSEPCSSKSLDSEFVVERHVMAKYTDSTPLSEDAIFRCKSALLNSVILDCIFGFLNVEELKKFRLVCRDWNNVAEVMIHKKAAVCFTNTSERSLSNFASTFRQAKTQIPFQAVQLNPKQWTLKNISQLSWSCLQLHEFFQFWTKDYKVLTSVQLNNLKIHNSTTWAFINIYSMAMTVPSTLTSLTVDCKDATFLVFSVDQLAYIKFLNFSNEVILDIGSQGKKLKPKEITLQNVRFLQGRCYQENICLNSFIDFSEAKKVSISNSPPITLYVGLDVHASNIQLDYLLLNGVDIIESGLPFKWQIQKQVCLKNIPEIFNTTMTYKKLHIKNMSIDVSSLSQEIQCLRLESPKYLFYTNYIFPFANLRYLQLDAIKKEKFCVLLFPFRKCRQLTDLYLEIPYSQADFVLDLDYIPQSIKRLEIYKITELRMKNFLELDTLILSKWPLPWVLKTVDTCHALQFKNLVINLEELEGFENIAQYRRLKKLTSMLTTFYRTRPNINVCMGPLKLNKGHYLYKKFVEKSPHLLWGIEGKYYFLAVPMEGKPKFFPGYEAFLKLKINKEKYFTEENDVNM